MQFETGKEYHKIFETGIEYHTAFGMDIEYLTGFEKRYRLEHDTAYEMGMQR